jgi:regulator of protease activity HflC (stomatin/prohibitin superfamily)
MLVRTIRGLAAKVQEAREAAEPGRGGGTSSEKRRRQTEKDLEARRYVSGVSLLAFFLSLAAGGIFAGIVGSPFPFLAAVLVGVFLLFALKVANQWERAVVLRFGRFVGLKGPGLFILIPVVDEVSQLVDQRVRVTDVSAESALSKDTVPVNVDAIVFWTVWDAQKAVLEVADYLDAIALSAQTALRETIGRHMLAEMITEREQLGKQLQAILDEKTNPWGITVQSVEIRDVKIPPALEDAMSRQAQAERERQARIILGTAETEISARFVEAGDAYKDHPLALHLRAMNMLYEAIKEKGSMVIVPSSAVETMGLGGLTGVTALAQKKETGE